MTDPAQVPVDLEPGERPLKAGSANMQRGAETVGGTLYLTSLRLVHAPHALNLQSTMFQIPVGAITEVTPAWTKLLGKLPVIPNSIEATVGDGTVHSFVVTGRRAWIAAIDRARGGAVAVG
ncbi:GRAM domain-containing protein [Brachybacterium sp. FME24]|uniref:GRAM domain-containing protein n=1 Tax=Brachybacterium sp. FME24 TaxID=2742605 RepID=UPI001867F26A|nr:GRAM domain-containing protein [Brachybacterium sp. FME24]